MDLRRLRYFVTLAEELHFGRAARRLHIVQPALSQQIRTLEEEIGAALVERTTRRLALTTAGEVLLERGRRVLADTDRAVVATQEAARGMTGRIAVSFVGAAAIQVVPRALAAFRSARPDVHISVHELGSAEQLRAIEDGRVDVGFVLLPADVGKLALEVASEERLVVVLPRRHRLASRARLPLAALSGEDIVWMARRSEPRIFELYVSLCLEAGFSPRIAYEVDHLQSMLGLVSAGLGVSHGPASIADAIPAGVVCRPLVRPAVRANIGMVHSPANRSKTLAAFLACRPQTRAPLG